MNKLAGKLQLKTAHPNEIFVTLGAVLKRFTVYHRLDFKVRNLITQLTFTTLISLSHKNVIV
jgi:hypothetical protein